MKKTCFVVLNYNDSETTIKLVDDLILWKKHKDIFKIIVVDNHSSDDSYKTLKDIYKENYQIDVILTEKNGGYSYGNNIGVTHAIEKYQPEYIVISNPDIKIDEYTFDELLNTFEIHKNVVMVAPVMKSMTGEYKIYSQTLPTYMDDLLACFNSSKSRTIHEFNYEYIENDFRTIKTQMLPGSFFVVRTKEFQKIGMFDENVFLFCEERILGKKMQDNNYEIALRADLFFVHVHSTSIRKSYDILKTWEILMKSRLYYEKKYNKISDFKEKILNICMNLFLKTLKLKMWLYKVIKGKIE